MRTEPFHIPSEEARKLHEAAYSAQQDGHREVCGLVLADAEGTLRLVFMPNRAERSYRFERAWADIDRAKAELGPGEEVLGSFHSHPIGTPIPSPGDREGGFVNGVELIYDVCGAEMRLWRLVSDAAGEQPVELTMTGQVTTDEFHEDGGASG